MRALDSAADLFMIYGQLTAAAGAVDCLHCRAYCDVRLPRQLPASGIAARRLIADLAGLLVSDRRSRGWNSH
jgi:hypothetical protein